jgi:hypothetical protein
VNILPGDVVTLPAGDAVVTRVTDLSTPGGWTRLVYRPESPPRDPRGIATVTHTTNRAAKRAAQKARR